MSATITVHCEDRVPFGPAAGGAVLHGRCPRRVDVPGAVAVGEARERAAGHGWARLDGRDLCPTHAGAAA